ncbi:unnamed protein product [Spirodela intermedia]|uniref:INO80 complex subunit B-like conserved region domain-containing protein n=1 Tax=Spirodela intermedia TaxID=51605 RepID=A0A7I8J239_SPIIN|nr:unnamed protein product [Spirodela intermedia]CAA6664285.1 unnamed protein product [Spirodela intermedia]
MDEFGVSGFNGVAAVAKRRRSTTSRRPRLDSQALLDGRDPSPPSTTPSSENASKNSTDGSSSHDTGFRRKEVNLNSLRPGSSGSNAPRSSEGVLAPASWKNIARNREGPPLDGHVAGGKSSTEAQAVDRSESAPGGVMKNRVRKVKLKVGGVTRTIHAKSNGDSSFEGGSSSSKPPDPMVAAPWKDFSDQSPSGTSKEADDKTQSTAVSEPVRKSKRVPKRRVLDGAYDGEDADEEIRYLERLRASKLSSDQQETSGSESKKRQKVSRVSRRGSYEEMMTSLCCGERDSEDRDYIDEEEEGGSDASESLGKTPRQESLDSLPDSRKEFSLTTRQRALQTGRDGSSGSAASLVEYPDGLPPAPPRRQKGKLSEVEQQLKKAEAAQRRRLQVEKAARSPRSAEAIRKILGQDSNRKKREEKLQKKRDELAQARRKTKIFRSFFLFLFWEKVAKSMASAGNTVRWILGPEGTTVTFLRLYPPPREKCAGPTCTRPYRYRHSKLNLPLCSLQCYRAVEQVVQQ